MPAQQGSLPQVEMPAHGVAAAFPVGVGPASDMGLTMSPPMVVTKATATRYRSSSRAVRAQVLDELCELTGWHRDHARKELRETFGPRRVRPPGDDYWAGSLRTD